MQSLKYLILIMTTAAAAIGQEQTGQSVFRNVFQNITTAQASPALRNIGQTNHILIVRAHTGTAQLGGLVCRIEASTDNAAWFPITVDLSFLPALGNPALPYSIVKGNGVYPYLRVSCPTVPSSPGLDVSYIGSQYPYGDVVLATDRYLTTSIGGKVADLAAPPEPTSTDGITTIGSWATICPQDASCSNSGITDNGNGTMTFSQTADHQGAFGHDATEPASPVMLAQTPGTTWNKVILKVGPYSTATLGTGCSFKALIMRDSTSQAGVVFTYMRDSTAQGDFGQGGTGQWLFRVYNSENINSKYAAGNENVLLNSAGQGATEKPIACLAVAKSGTDLTFSYSYDCVSFANLGTLTATQYRDTNGNTPAMNLNQLGLFGLTQMLGSTATAISYPISFTVSRFKFY